MKILLTALNSKFIHSNLAIYCLKNYAEEKGITSEITLAEYTINQRTEDILESIYEKSPDMVAFSVYIWNVEMIKELIWNLHNIRPGLPIWIGGPEVSFELEKTYAEFEGIAGIIVGEGEEPFFELLEYYEGKRKLEQVAGVFYKENEESIYRPNGECLSLSDVPFPYPNLLEQDLDTLANKIVYYESSRGCPFKCSYCLSSVDHKLRFRDIELVKKELQIFLDAKVNQVKFVDRTFNCDRKRSLEIWKYIKENDNGVTNFHFEIGADLIDEAQLELISDMRPDLIQLEIGVQSTNEKTLKEIQRYVSFELLSKVVNKVKAFGNIHQHLDLIAGLPYEDYESFGHSFDDVYALRPDQLQLGFLKVLKGSLMYDRKDEYGIVYKKNAPYEVLSTKWLPYDDVIRLKGLEEVLEIYYNSGQYINTLEYLMHFWERPFDFYQELALYYKASGAKERSLNRNAKYELLYHFVCEKRPNIKSETADLLTYDLYLREPAKSRPSFSMDLSGMKDEISAESRRCFELENNELERAIRKNDISGECGGQPSGCDKTTYRQYLHDVHFDVCSFDLEKLVSTGKSEDKRHIYHIDYRK